MSLTDPPVATRRIANTIVAGSWRLAGDVRHRFGKLSLRARFTLWCAVFLCAFGVAVIVAINLVLSFGDPTGFSTTIPSSGITPAAGSVPEATATQTVAASSGIVLVHGVDVATLHRVRFVSLGVLVVALIAGGIGAYWLAGVAVRPVLRMADDARGVTARTIEKRIGVAGGRELAGLAEAFNATLDRLERSLDQQHRFAGDAAHELLTPITTMRAAIEVGRSHDEMIPVIERNLVRFEKLVVSLLLLAREERTTVVERFAFGLVVEEVVHDLTPLAHAAEVSIWIRSDTELSMVGDRAALATCCRNLIENAIRYNHVGGEVRCDLGQEAGNIILTVADTGIGIPSADLPHVFDRFYRVRQPRNASGTGHGLGLSIAQHIARQHGGTISVDSVPESGTTFRLSIPVA